MTQTHGQTETQTDTPTDITMGFLIMGLPAPANDGVNLLGHNPEFVKQFIYICFYIFVGFIRMTYSKF